MAAIDLNTVRSTIEARLATELASSPAIPVVFNNMAFDSTTEDTFVQCLTSFGAHQYLTQGDTTNAFNDVVGLIGDTGDGAAGDQAVDGDDFIACTANASPGDMFDIFTDGERWYVHGVAKDASEVPFATAAG